MRALFALMLMTSAAAAECNPDLLAVTDWSIKPVNAERNELSTNLVWKGDKPIRMIDASVGFRDALGETISLFDVDRDRVVRAGGTFSQVDEWGPHTFERLLQLRPGEVTTFTCVRAVLYEDGTKDVFE